MFSFQNPFHPADILLPHQTDMSLWSVVACDQYTSEPEYWDAVSAYVGDAPSTLHITLPEIELGRQDTGARVQSINQTMRDYLEKGLLSEYPHSYFYVERTLRNGKIRRGLIGMLDLECYDYHSGSQTPIRATEGTVLDRLPPRVAVRQNAVLELPHIMLLIDDPEQTVIEPLSAQKQRFQKVYDFELMQHSGHLSGYAVEHALEAGIANALSVLGDQQRFAQRYGVSDKQALLYAVGDGNHSLATAKECYEQIKRTLSEQEALTHPSRYALVEIVNLHDPSLEFEAIHRVVFGVDVEHLLRQFSGYYNLSKRSCGGQPVTYITADKTQTVYIQNPSSNLAVGSLQNFLDSYLAEFGGKVDYIHGEEVVRQLGSRTGNVGFLLPDMDKKDLFPTVILDGALPRKTFSMGHAWDKRFYLECRKVK